MPNEEIFQGAVFVQHCSHCSWLPVVQPQTEQQRSPRPMENEFSFLKKKSPMSVRLAPKIVPYSYNAWVAVSDNLRQVREYELLLGTQRCWQYYSKF